MTKKEFLEIHDQRQLEVTQDFIQDYLSFVRTEMPYADQTISTLEEVDMCLGGSIEDILRAD